jgi:hypothetical protein
VKTGGLAGAHSDNGSGNGFVSFDLLVVDDLNAVHGPGSLLWAASALGGLLARPRRRRAQG